MQFAGDADLPVVALPFWKELVYGQVPNLQGDLTLSVLTFELLWGRSLQW